MTGKVSGRKRRVYYATDEFHRKTRVAASLSGEVCTDFVTAAISERIDRLFSAEQQEIVFHRRIDA